MGKTLDPASPDYGWTDAGPVVWSDGVEDSNAIDPGIFRDSSNGSLWLTYGVVLRLHPAGRARSEDRHASVSAAHASQRRDQLGSVDHHLPRRLVLPAGDARIMLRRRRVQLQHSSGPRPQGHRPVSRPLRSRHAAGRRLAVSRFVGARGRCRPLRPARSRRRRPEVLVSLRGRSGSRRHQRPRHPAAALA